MFNSKYLALELSDKTLRYCFLEKAGASLSISQTGNIDLGDVHFSSELFSKALAEVLAKIGTAHVKLFVNILRRESLINSIVLPQMPPKELEEVINGEIIKVPSFYDKKFDFTYASYPYIDTKIRVIYCAVFSEIVNGIIKAAKGLKLDLQDIALAPVSLLANAYTWGESQAEQMLVVVEDSSSYVVAFQNKQCKFFYSGSMGRSSLFKTGTCDKLSMMAWTAEINRIISSYFVTHGGQAIQKVYLIWNDEGAEGLAAELEEQLGKPVVRPNLQMFSGITQKNGAQINPSYFVALGPVVAFYKNLKSEFSFQKFLESLNFKSEIIKLVGQLAIFAAFCALMVALIGKLALSESRKTSVEVKQVKDKIELLQKEKEKDNTDALQADHARQVILAQIRTVNDLNKISWSQIFDEIIKRLPQGVSFTSFKVLDDGRVDIQGRAYDIEIIGTFMRSLGNINLLQDVKVGEIKDTQSDQANNNDQQVKKTFSFEITADLVNG